MKTVNDPSASALLAEAIEAAEPFVVEAAQTTVAALDNHISVAIAHGDPMRVSVHHDDESGRRRTFDAVGTGPVGGRLAAAAAALLAAGLNGLPPDKREKVSKVVAAGGTLVLTLDATLRMAIGTLDVSGREPLALFTAQSGDVH